MDETKLSQQVDKTKTKICKDCNKEKPLLDNFYKAGRGYQTLCKPCHNKKRMKSYVKTPAGFYALSEETRNGILDDMRNGRKFTEISKKYNIKYHNLPNWKRKGFLNLE